MSQGARAGTPGPASARRADSRSGAQHRAMVTSGARCTDAPAAAVLGAPGALHSKRNHRIGIQLPKLGATETPKRWSRRSQPRGRGPPKRSASRQRLANRDRRPARAATHALRTATPQNECAPSRSPANSRNSSSESVNAATEPTHATCLVLGELDPFRRLNPVCSGRAELDLLTLHYVLPLISMRNGGRAPAPVVHSWPSVRAAASASLSPSVRATS